MLRTAKQAALVLLAAATLVLLAAAGLFVFYARDLPRPEYLGELDIAKPTRIYDRTGRVLLYEVFGEEERQFVALGDLPPHVGQAVVSAEDADFYRHAGIDPRGVARALLTNLRRQGLAQGGSTISQQLVRTLLLTTEKTVERKVKEMILTLELERRLSKDEIMELYLNQVPLGSTAYGVGAASQLYFAKRAEELSVAEAAALAAMIQAPTYYSPFGEHGGELLQKKDRVVERMEELGYISRAQTEEALAQEVAFAEPSRGIRAPHFSLAVTDQLIEEFGEEFVRANGLTVISSLDWGLQQEAEAAVRETAERNAAFGAHNASLAALDPRTGDVLALVGSKDWFADPFPEGCSPGRDCLFDPKVNVATRLSGRQPGSAFKPFVYAAAFLKGASPEDTLVDEETNFGVWGGEEYVPQNYDGLFRGEVTLRRSLAQSLNVPSVKVLMDLAGIKNALETASLLGIGTLGDESSYGPSLALGAAEVRLLDMVSAYGVFAADGKTTSPRFVKEVRDENGLVVRSYERSLAQVLDPRVAGEITDVLSDNEARVPVFRPNSSLVVPGHRVAAKTGTTQESRDAWTLGYAAEVVVGVWVGNNDNTPMAQQPGVVLAAPIWNRVITSALTTP